MGTQGCACCASGGDLSVYVQQVAEKVHTHGVALVGVTPTAEWENYLFYTVGLTLHGHPELAVSVPDGDFAGVFNRVAMDALTHARAGDGPLRPGDMLPLDDEVSLRVRGMPKPRSVLHVARSLYGRQMRGVQLLWPDDNHRFPDDKSYDHNYRQLLL